MKMSPRLKPLGLAVILLQAFLSAGPVWAQTPAPVPASTDKNTNTPEESAPVKLSDFVVSTDHDNGYRATNSISATHIDTPIQDLPFNMQVVTPAFMKDIAAFDVQSALQYVPGVTAATDTGATIRGFTGNWTQRDGFQWLDPDDVANVDRIEVIRGPNAVLYGQGVPGGYVNYVTKRPVFGQQFAELDGEAGSFRFKRAAIDYNQSAGPVAVRFLAANYNSDGYANLSHTYEHNRMHMVEPEISVKLPTDTVITVDAEYTLYERTKPNGMFTVGQADGSQVPLPVLYAIPTFKSWNGPLFNDENSIRNIMAVVDQKVGSNLSFEGGFMWYYRTDNQIYAPNPAAATGDPANPGVEEIRGQWLHKMNGNTNYSWRGDALYKFDVEGMKNQIMVGFWRNDYEFRQGRQQDMTYNAGYTPPQGGAPDPFQNIGYYQNISNNSTSHFEWYNILDPAPNLNTPVSLNWVWNPAFFLKQDTKEQYIYATYQGHYFNDKLISLVGISHDDLVEVNTSPGNNPPQYKTTIASGTENSPLVGLIYRPLPPLSIYGLASSSLSLNSGQDGNGNFLPPRKGTSIEGGVKVDFFGGRLSGTASVYQIDFKNRVEFDPNAPNPVGPAPTGANILIGADKSNGVDLDLLANPSPGWQIVFGYSYLDEYISHDINPVAVGQHATGFIPNTWKLWNNYEFRQGELTGFSIGGGLIWYDHDLLSYVGGTHPEWEKSFFTGDLRLGYTGKIGKHSYRIDVNAKNLIKTPLAVGYSVSNNYTPYYFQYPTQYFLSVEFDL